MSLHNYQLIKVCYPIVLIPINPFVLDILLNNCGCPQDHIAIYFLQDGKGIEKTIFFFNYSLALKEYKSKIKDQKNKIINDESDLLTFQVEIPNNFNYATDEINDINIFKVTIINVHSNQDLENIKNNLSAPIINIENTISDIKQDSFKIYDLIKGGNIYLKNILSQSELSADKPPKNKFS